MSKTSLWAGVTVLVVGVVVVLMLLVKMSSDLGSGSAVSLKTALAATDWTRGSASSSKVTLIEYADFQCPACASYHPLVKELEREFPNDLLVVYRHFPLPQHKNAVMASVAAEAAGKQGKFWEMHDVLFEKQTEWSDVSDPKELFGSYAIFLGLNGAQFAADLLDPSLEAKVNSQKLDGVKNNVNSTPTFFLDGVRLVNPRSYASFKELVVDALEKADKSSSN